MIKVNPSNNPAGIASKVINGIPYIECGWCTQVAKLHDAKNIRILVDFEKMDEKFEIVTLYNHPDPFMNGQRGVRSQYRPVIQTVLGCSTCWNEMDIKSTREKPWSFSKLGDGYVGSSVQRQIPVIPDTTCYKKVEKVEYKVVKIAEKEDLHQQRRFMRDVFRSTHKHMSIAEESTAVLKPFGKPRLNRESRGEMYGPFKDRKGK